MKISPREIVSSEALAVLPLTRVAERARGPRPRWLELRAVRARYELVAACSLREVCVSTREIVPREAAAMRRRQHVVLL